MLALENMPPAAAETMAIVLYQNLGLKRPAILEISQLCFFEKSGPNNNVQLARVSLVRSSKCFSWSYLLLRAPIKI